MSKTVAFETSTSGHESDWRNRAECRSRDPELWWPVGSSEQALDQGEEAKAICQQCPVLAPCDRWADEQGMDVGVWGGLTEDERRSRRRSRNRAKAAEARRLAELAKVRAEQEALAAEMAAGLPVQLPPWRTGPIPRQGS